MSGPFEGHNLFFFYRRIFGSNYYSHYKIFFNQLHYIFLRISVNFFFLQVSYHDNTDWIFIFIFPPLHVIV